MANNGKETNSNLGATNVNFMGVLTDRRVNMSHSSPNMSAHPSEWCIRNHNGKC